MWITPNDAIQINGFLVESGRIGVITPTDEIQLNKTVCLLSRIVAAIRPNDN